MAGRVVGHRRVAVDGVPADEVVGVDHALGVGAEVLAVEAEAAEHRRGGGRARGRVVDPPRPALVGQHEHLARPVELNVLASLREAQLERAAARSTSE